MKSDKDLESNMPWVFTLKRILNGKILGKRYRYATRAFRMLPSFLVIGAQRGGTTSLHHYLSMHPHIAPPIKKEIQFFSLHYHLGIEWYRHFFPIERRLFRASEESQRNATVTFESTPYYVFHPRVPERVYASLPDVKLVLLLRDPVERAYSHYCHHLRLGSEQGTFEEAVSLEGKRLDGEYERIMNDPTYASHAYQHYSYLSRGMYLDQIHAWLKYFDTKRMLIVDSGHLFQAPEKTLRKIWRFLNLQPCEVPAGKVYNASDHGNMSRSTRDRLKAFFKRHNERLFDYLNVDFGWNQSIVGLFLLECFTF